MVGAVLVAACLASCRQQRRGVIALALTMTIATGCGLAARHETAVKFIRQFSIAASAETINTPTTAAAAAAPEPARIKCGIQIDNSLAIRRSLIGQALVMIPQAGLLGLGLDAFEQRTCLGMPPHNLVLQTVIELGWIAGAALVLLMASVAWRLIPIARANRPAAFLLCALAYACALSMVHGRLSRQGDVFLLLGAGAGVVAARQRTSQHVQPN